MGEYCTWFGSFGVILTVLLAHISSIIHSEILSSLFYAERAHQSFAWTIWNMNIIRCEVIQIPSSTLIWATASVRCTRRSLLPQMWEIHNTVSGKLNMHTPIRLLVWTLDARSAQRLLLEWTCVHLCVYAVPFRTFVNKYGFNKYGPKAEAYVHLRVRLECHCCCLRVIVK